MEQLAIFSPRHAARIAELLAWSGHEVVTYDETPDTLGAIAAAIVDATEGLDWAFAVARDLKRRLAPAPPVIVLVERHQVDELALRESLLDDFAVSPFDAHELTMRLRHLLVRFGRGDARTVIRYGPLVLEPDTYQASLNGEPLDLTYMEYELLKFLASHPGKVFSRETLLSRVWGYEYYGGARTVDVHIRRLRAKLGDAHEDLIHTVRSVGYRFGDA
jgi:two-component system alkaline phosphatase synthesis response regulator PhoP